MVLGVFLGFDIICHLNFLWFLSLCFLISIFIFHWLYLTNVYLFSFVTYHLLMFLLHNFLSIMMFFKVLSYHLPFSYFLLLIFSAVLAYHSYANHWKHCSFSNFRLFAFKSMSNKHFNSTLAELTEAKLLYISLSKCAPTFLSLYFLVVLLVDSIMNIMVLA